MLNVSCGAAEDADNVFPKENERMTIYIPAHTLKSAARPQVCRSQVLVIKLSKLTRSKNDN